MSQMIKLPKKLMLLGSGELGTAKATHYTMNRDRIRELAHQELGVRTAKYAYATTLAQMEIISQQIGFPTVVKPVMSSSGKGQSVVNHPSEVEYA